MRALVLLVAMLSAQQDFSDYRDLNDLANRVREANKVPATAVATWKDGKIDSAVSGERNFGKSDPVTPGDLWLVGSIGKSMTSTLIATLIDEGKLSWDSKLGDVVKDVPIRDEYRQITIEQVMRHRGGIPQDQTMDGATVNRIVGKLKDPVEIRAAYVNDLLGRPPIGKPDETFAYSNGDYALLGHIAETLCHKPYEKLMVERVFAMIGMKSAVVGMPGQKGMPSGPDQPHGHAMGANGPVPYVLQGTIVPMVAPAGVGIACTIEDLARYAAWHLRELNGENLGLKPETVRRLHTLPPNVKQGELPYAAGWAILGDADAPMHWHNGSDGSFLAEMSIWPKQKLAAVAIINIGAAKRPTAPMQAIQAFFKKAR